MDRLPYFKMFMSLTVQKKKASDLNFFLFHCHNGKVMDELRFGFED
jgi:hypothetical protein